MMNNPLSYGLDLVGFKASAVTLVEGTSTFVPELLLHLCAYTAGRRNQDVVFVDGGNSFNPYTLRRITKLMQADPKTVLQRTHVARAFTEYQLNDLLVQQLTPAIKQWEPGMLAVAYLPYLFGDMHVRKLLEQAVEHIKEVTRTYHTTTIITSYGGNWWGSKIVEECADRVIRVVQRRKLRIIDEKDVIEFAPVSPGQMRLNAYTAVV
jgi:hypothetical protein